MIVKIYGKSDLQTLSINNRRRIPQNEGDLLTIMGWGWMDSLNDEKATTLQEVDLNYLPPEKCQVMSGQVGSQTYSMGDFLTDSMMCADAIGKDSCRGDSGGPLIIKDVNGGDDPANDIQVGIASWGFGCAVPDFSSVYARVSSQSKWIKETVCDLSFSPPSSFGCDATSTSQVDGYTMIFLKLKLDMFSGETGWLIETEKKGDHLAGYGPVGSYEGQPGLITVPIGRCCEMFVKVCVFYCMTYWDTIKHDPKVLFCVCMLILFPNKYCIYQISYHSACVFSSQFFFTQKMHNDISHTRKQKI
mmetsp:Transcript_15518/g.22693  ORF Transcript_15518/g.22693 Transcript_15518/m.22693 type:complete len:303 (+) Transcript_15518:2-910(+)